MKSLRLVIVLTVITELLIMSFTSYFYQWSIDDTLSRSPSSSSSWKYGGTRFSLPYRLLTTISPSVSSKAKQLNKLLMDAYQYMVDDGVTWPVHVSVSWAGGHACSPLDDDDGYATLSNIARSLSQALSAYHVINSNNRTSAEYFDFIYHVHQDHNRLTTASTPSVMCDDLSLSQLIPGRMQPSNYQTTRAQGKEEEDTDDDTLRVFISCGCSFTTISSSAASSSPPVEVNSSYSGNNILVRLPSFHDTKTLQVVLDRLIQGPLTRLIYNELFLPSTLLSSQPQQLDRLYDTSMVHFHIILAGNILLTDNANNHRNIDHTTTRNVTTVQPQNLDYHHRNNINHLAIFENNMRRIIKPLLHDTLGQIFQIHTYLHTIYDSFPLIISNIVHQTSSSSSSSARNTSLNMMDYSRSLFQSILNRFSLEQQPNEASSQRWTLIIYVPTSSSSSTTKEKQDETPLFFTNAQGKRRFSAISQRDRAAIYIANQTLVSTSSCDLTTFTTTATCSPEISIVFTYIEAIVKKIMNLSSNKDYGTTTVETYTDEKYHFKINHLRDQEGQGGISQREINILKRKVARYKINRTIISLNDTLSLIMLKQNHTTLSLRRLHYVGALPFLFCVSKLDIHFFFSLFLPS